MGSGVTKNFDENIHCIKSDSNLDNHVGMKNKKIVNINGNLYMKIKREEYKLKPNVLKGFSYFNNFSRDVDDDFPIFK
jgi:hypothetical protein